MTRLALLLFAVFLAPSVWSEDGGKAWPRNWTVNVSGPWQITGCPQGNRTLQVQQDGHRLSQEHGSLEGEVHGHSVSFSVPAQALDCLPHATALRFDGEAQGARIVGMVRALDDHSRRVAITIQLQREFMLSFDDGPLPGRTDRVLDALKRLHAQDGKPVRAAFFTVGDAPHGFWEGRAFYAPYEIWTDKGSMRAYPELVRRIVADGHVIGNHSAHHAWFRWPRFDATDVVANELREWERTLPVPQTEKLFRPPYLVATAPMLAAAKNANYQIVLGDTVGDAAPGSNVDAIEWKALKILESRDGSSPALLIFHDILPASFAHLEEIVGRLQRQGYTLVHFDARRLDGKTLIGGN